MYFIQVEEKDIVALESVIQEAKRFLPIFFTKMAPIHFFPCRDVSCKVSLRAVENMIVLCLSGIGFADSFIQRIERVPPYFVFITVTMLVYYFSIQGVNFLQMGAAYVDHQDFSDHHLFQMKVRVSIFVFSVACSLSSLI